MKRAHDHLLAIGECSFCPERFLGYEAGENEGGRRVYVCWECRMMAIERMKTAERMSERKPPQRALSAAAGPARLKLLAKGAGR